MFFFLLLSSWTVEKSNPSSFYARDFANAEQQRPELSATKKLAATRQVSMLPVSIPEMTHW